MESNRFEDLAEGRMPPKEAEDFMQAIQEDAELRQEWQDYLALHQRLSKIGQRVMVEKSVQSAINSALIKRRMRFAVFAIGLLISIGYFLYSYFHQLSIENRQIRPPKNKIGIEPFANVDTIPLEPINQNPKSKPSSNGSIAMSEEKVSVVENTSGLPNSRLRGVSPSLRDSTLGRRYGCHEIFTVKQMEIFYNLPPSLSEIANSLWIGDTIKTAQLLVAEQTKIDAMAPDSGDTIALFRAIYYLDKGEPELAAAQILPVYRSSHPFYYQLKWLMVFVYKAQQQDDKARNLLVAFRNSPDTTYRKAAQHLLLE